MFSAATPMTQVESQLIELFIQRLSTIHRYSIPETLEIKVCNHWVATVHPTPLIVEPGAGITDSEEEQHCSTRKDHFSLTFLFNTNTLYVINAE